MAKKSNEKIEKVKDALGPNVIIGDKAIVYFYHRVDGEGVIDELAEHHFAEEFVDWAIDSAQKGVDKTGWNFKSDTDRHAAGKKGYGLRECTSPKNGAPRVYLQRGKWGDKELYFVACVGDKNTQKEDFKRAYTRIKTFNQAVSRGLISMDENIERAKQIAEEKKKQKEKQQKAEENSTDWRVYYEKNRRDKLRRRG